MTNWTIPGSPTNPILWTVGDSVPLSLQFTGATTVTVTEIKCYKNETDYTSTAFPSGSTAAAGDTVTSKPLLGVANDGDEVYIIAWKCGVDSNTEVRKTYVKIEAAETES